MLKKTETMPAAWLRWRPGRQNQNLENKEPAAQGGAVVPYQKMLLATCSRGLHFDAYLLKYPTGSSIPYHRDSVSSKRHYRLNILLKRAHSGGTFKCAKTLLKMPRIVLFRPDLHEHAVTAVAKGTRYVFSIGWVLGAK